MNNHASMMKNLEYKFNDPKLRIYQQQSPSKSDSNILKANPDELQSDDSRSRILVRNWP